MSAETQHPSGVPRSGSSGSVSLDRSSEPWVGAFPGLGRVEVWADGRIATHPEPGTGTDSDEPLALRDAALRHGWGEPLALARRGHVLIYGSALLDPASGHSLLIIGDSHDAAIAILGLAERGWLVIADRPAPLTIGDDVHAHPRTAPTLAAAGRTRRAGITGTDTRTDSDTHIVDLARADGPWPVGGIATMRARRPLDPVLEPFTGHQRVEVAQGMPISGLFTEILDGDLDGGIAGPAAARAAMARTMRLAALPTVAAHVDPAAPDETIDALLDWWNAR